MNGKTRKNNNILIVVAAILHILFLAGVILAIFLAYERRNENVSVGAQENSSIDLYADTYDVIVGKSKKVTFYAEINKKTIPKRGKVILYADEESVGELLDDGQSPDKTANDGIYTAALKLCEDEAKNVNYTVKIKKIVSSPFKICFYQKISDDDFEDFDRLLSRKIEKFDSKQEVVEFLQSDGIQDKIRTVTENDDSVIYESIYGISGVWIEENYFSQDTKQIRLSNKQNSLNKSPSGNTYRKLVDKLSACYAESGIDNNNVAVIRPFRSSQFQYDDFLTVGEMIADETGGSVKAYDEKKATLSTFMNLDKFGVVLIDSHGYLDKANNEIFICLSQNYKDVGSEFSADYSAGNIIVASDGKIFLHSRFIDKYYKKGALDGSLFFLGSCYSMFNDSIAKAFINKGAYTVYGYSDKVSISYCNNTLVETLIENMLLDNQTSSEAYKDTINTYSRTDPNNENTVFLMMNAKEVDFCKDNFEVTGKVKSEKTGNPLFGVTVEVTENNGADTDQSEVVANTKTDRNGEFSIKIPNGEYDFLFCDEDYEEASSLVTSNGKDIVIDDVMLKKVQTDKLKYEMKEVNIETKTSSGVLYCNSKITYPYFSGSLKTAEILNDRYADIIKDYKTKNTKGVDEVYYDMVEYGDTYMLPFTDDYEVEVKYDKNGYVSCLETNHYFTGGAHMYHDELGVTYSIKTGKIMKASDFFNGTERDINDVLNYYYAESDAGRIFDPYDGWWQNTSFVLSEKGVCFYVNVGDAVPRAEVVVPYTSKSSPIISAEKAKIQYESTFPEKLTDESAEELWSEANDVYCTWTYWREDKGKGYSDKGYADIDSSVEQKSNFSDFDVTYYQIRHDEIDSVEELKRYLSEYFDDKICDEITSMYIDYDGHLYCQALEIGGDFSEPAGVSVKHQNGNKATILVKSRDLLYEDWILNGMDDVDEYSEVEQTMEYENGKWIFTGSFVYDY